MAQVGWLFLLGVPEGTMALVTTFISVNGWLQHADADLRTGYLDGIFATNAVHRVHHEVAGPVANFSSNLVIWDRIFSTYRRPTGAIEPIGLGPVDLPDRYLAHLIAPVRWPPGPPDQASG